MDLRKAVRTFLFRSPGRPEGAKAVTMASSPKVHMDENFIQYAFQDDRAAIVTALAAAIGTAKRTVRLIGSTIDDLCIGLRGHGYRVDHVKWSFGNPIPIEGLGPGILCEIPQTFEDWAQCAVITADSALQPIWRVILHWSLLREMLSKYEYNASTLDELIKVYRGHSTEFVGRRSNDHIARIESVFPLHGKTVIEFGPSDGNYTADLLASGAAHVLAIEGRPENIVKLLVAKHVMNWKNFDVVMDNFQTPGSWAQRRYDFVFATGVYYHCQNPLIFLDMLTRLADVVFIGGWVATDEKPQGPWLSLNHEGAGYRGKPYLESYHFLSGLARTSYMLERSEIEHFLRLRGFDIKYCEVTIDKNGLGTEFARLLAIKQPA